MSLLSMNGKPSALPKGGFIPRVGSRGAPQTPGCSPPTQGVLEADPFCLSAQLPAPLTFPLLPSPLPGFSPSPSPRPPSLCLLLWLLRPVPLSSPPQLLRTLPWGYCCAWGEGCFSGGVVWEEVPVCAVLV